MLHNGVVRCWGYGYDGQLGYGNNANIGDNEIPLFAGSVNIDQPVIQLAAGELHTCALLNNGAVQCWGRGSRGRLGYANTDNIGDTEPLTPAGHVDVGGTVIQLAAGGLHTCALLDNGAIRCWGSGEHGQLGYANTDDVGDDETPTAAGDVDLYETTTQLVAGGQHTCALFDRGAVRCWGNGSDARLGYANTDVVGDNEIPASAGDVDVGEPAVQLDAGFLHTCALLDNGAVRCWGNGSSGQLGYANTDTIGDNETPASTGDVDVGGTVIQLAAGAYHTCAVLDNGAVRCWGYGYYGQLGYANNDDIGDDEAPVSAGDVDVGGAVRQLAAGDFHTCALFKNHAVRCWGSGSNGQLGYANNDDIGNDETPASAGDVIVSELAPPN
ncbi:RCC1 domain-containing protein [Haliangium sp.]|uniref:RCC1 domain-containing protein n=1 Tax=Haliangium sp. TaxID=2663208 RepID=UPI003D0F859A